MKKWTDADKIKIRELWEEAKTKNSPAKWLSTKLGVSYYSLRGIIKRMRKTGELSDTLRYFEGLSDYQEEELFEEPTLNQERLKIDKKFDIGKPLRILGISDLHIPFQDTMALKEVIKESADVCVIIGDFLDFYSISRFRKSKLIPLKRELMDGLIILETLSKRYKDVVMITANHEKRLLKIIQDKFSDHPEVIDILKPVSNTLRDMANKFPNIITTNSWWARIGDTIFSHGDWYCKTPTKTSQNSYEYFITEGIDFGAIVNGHTHHMSMIPYKHKWLIENPCLCHKMDYMREGHRYSAEYHRGYSIVNLDKDGHFIPNKSFPYFLGW